MPIKFYPIQYAITILNPILKSIMRMILNMLSILYAIARSMPVY